MTFLYNGDLCPKCRCPMAIDPPPDKKPPSTRVKCLMCNHRGTLQEFAEAFDKEFDLDENGEVR